MSLMVKYQKKISLNSFNPKVVYHDWYWLYFSVGTSNTLNLNRMIRSIEVRKNDTNFSLFADYINTRI